MPYRWMIFISRYFRLVIMQNSQPHLSDDFVRSQRWNPCCGSNHLIEKVQLQPALAGHTDKQPNSLFLCLWCSEFHNNILTFKLYVWDINQLCENMHPFFIMDLLLFKHIVFPKCQSSECNQSRANICNINIYAYSKYKPRTLNTAAHRGQHLISSYQVKSVPYCTREQFVTEIILNIFSL